MLKYNLKQLTTNRGIQKPISFLLKLGFTYPTAKRALFDTFASIRFLQIKNLCIVFNCTPNDLMEWIPEENTQTENHPLKPLMRKQLPQQIQNIMADIPVSKLKEFEDKMIELKKELLK